MHALSIAMITLIDASLMPHMNDAIGPKFNETQSTLIAILILFLQFYIFLHIADELNIHQQNENSCFPCLYKKKMILKDMYYFLYFFLMDNRVFELF